MIFHKLYRAVLLVLLVATGAASLSAAPALSFVSHPLVSQIKQSTAGTPLALPWGVTLDSSGNLFLAEAGPGQIDEFNSANVFQGAIGAGTVSHYYTRSVAVDRATGDIYVGDASGEKVYVFKPAGPGQYTLLSTWNGAKSASGSFGNGYVSVAIDNSTSASDPHAGDVYVFATPSTIDVYKPKPPGAEEAQEGDWLEGLTTAGLELAGNGMTAAVDASSGSLYVPDAGNRAVDEFNREGKFTQAFKVASGPFAPIAVAVEESTHDVYAVDEAGASVDEFDSAGQSIGRITHPLARPISVAVNAGGDVYVSDADSEAPAVDVFGPGVLLPEVTTGSNEEVTRTSATLTGVVNPEGKEVTSCRFEYGASEAYGQSAACSPAPGSGSSAVPVSAKVSGLTAGVTYHYRLVASYSSTSNAGADGTFTTLQAVLVLTESATEVQGTSLIFNGAFEPEGLDTHYWFEYGTSKAYGSSTPHQDTGQVGEAQFIGTPVAGLEPNATYHFRIAAENSFGISVGADETVKTKAVVAALGELPASAITRVSATVSATINPENSPTTYRVLYGATSAYGEHSVEAEAPPGFGEMPIHVGLQGLAPDTTYHYALAASNQAGSVIGPDQTFTTSPGNPPTATTGATSELTLTSATVAGTVDPEGLETSYEIDFGPEATYGTSIFGEAGAGTGGVAVSTGLQNLAPGTTYHYRIVAINSDGKVYGADQTFTTPVYSNPIVLPATLPLLGTPAIAFPTEPQAPSVKKAPVKKKAKKGKRKKRKSRGKSNGRGRGSKGVYKRG